MRSKWIGSSWKAGWRAGWRDEEVDVTGDGSSHKQTSL